MRPRCLLLIVVFLHSSVGLAFDPQRVIDDALATYRYDRDAAIEMLTLAAAIEPNGELRRRLIDLATRLRNRSDDDKIALGPTTVKRLDLVIEQLGKMSFDTVSPDEKLWAFTGPGRPYALRSLREASEKSPSASVSRFEAVAGPLGPDERLAMRLLKQPSEIENLTTIAKKLRERKAVLEAELQRAADEPLLKHLYVGYVEAGGPPGIKVEPDVAQDSELRFAKAKLDKAERKLKDLLGSDAALKKKIVQAIKVGKPTATQKTAQQKLADEHFKNLDNIETLRSDVEVCRNRVERLKDSAK